MKGQTKEEKNHSSRMDVLLLALWILLATSISSSYAGHDDDALGRRNRGDYVFATTRGLSEMDMNPALKVPILPVTLVLDIIFLPFALIADTMAR